MPRGDDVELTESGRPKVPRPMPDTFEGTACPHCGADIGSGHAVCWNCSRDVRMKERSEEEILTEYQWMLAREELRLEARNLRFFGALTLFLLLAAVAWLLLRPEWGMGVLFALGALLTGRWAYRSIARMRRIRKANAL